MNDNQRFLRRETYLYGLGVYAICDIEAGELIASFNGEFYEAPNAMALPNDPPLYAGRHAIQWGRGKWRDGNVDEIARYVAHSCEPNCGIKDLFNIVAMRDIRADSELAWDYAMSEDSDFRMNCLCKSKECRNVVGSFSLLTPWQREKFVINNRGFISAWLVKKYRLY